MTGADASESQIVQNVTAENGFAYGVIGADIHVFGNGLPLYLLANWQPEQPGTAGWLREVPSRMLNARRAVVPFTGRTDELAQLRQWRDSDARLAVRWLHGPGGQGKTRLTAQLAAESASAGWKVVAAFHGPDADRPEPGSQDVRLVGAAGLLVIVDYADRWLLTNLTWLLKNALLHQTGVATRVLMVARTADSWPAVRGILDTHQADTSSQHLPGLGQESGERRSMFTSALNSFAAIYQLPGTEGIGPPGSLDDPEFGLTLAVHMAALVAVDACASGQRPPPDMAGLTIYLLDREQLHWTRLYAEGTAAAETAGSTYRTPPEVMNQTVFTAALTGTVTHGTGTALLENLQLSDPDQILQDHAVCYPSGDRSQTAVLEPLYPDRLAEDFLALTMPGHLADYPAQAWAASTATTLLTRRGDRHTPAAWTPRAITFLASAAHRWPHLGQSYLYPLLRRDPQLAVDAGSAALITIAGLPSITPAVLEAIEARLPDDRHVDLDTGIAALTVRLTDYRLTTTRAPDTRAPILDKLGFDLSRAGMYHRAAAAAEEAVEINRQLVLANPAVHDFGLAASLNNLAIFLSELGRHGEALAATEEAMEIRRRLARTSPAAQIWRQFIPTKPTAHKSGRAFSPDNLGSWLSDLGRHTEALARSTAADVARFRRRLARPNPGAEIRRVLTNTMPAAREGELALSLLNHSAQLFEIGLPEEALAVIEEAVGIWRRLARVNPAAQEDSLAAALINLGVILSDLRRQEEALAAGGEAVDILRRLARADSAAHEPDLALALTNHGADLSEIGRPEEALAVTGEAVEIRRRLARANPAAHEPGLATSLAYMGTLLSELGRAKEALATTEEAQEIRRRLAQANPSAHEQLLALPSAAATLTASASFTPTGVGSVCFRPAGGRAFRNVEDEIRQILDSDTDRATAVEITADSYGFTWIVIRRPPDQLESLVTDLHTVNSTLAKDGESLLCSLVAFRDPRQRQLAIVYLCERRTFYPFVPLPGEERAIELELSIKAAIERELPIETDLGRWFPVWDCPGLDTSLSELGRRDEALAATTEAAGIWRRLAQADAAHEADLARVLCNLGIDLSAAGREQEALAVTGEAVEIRRRLARADPAAHEPGLATSLAYMGTLLSELGRAKEALATTEEAQEIRRRLAQANPSAHEQLLALPSAAATLTASASFTPTGVGSVCFRPAGGRAFRNVEDEIRQILDSDTDRATAVEITADSYGFTWIVIRRPPDQLESLVTDLHTVNSTLAKDGESLLCSLVAFRDPRQRQLAIVYLCERRTFYPFVPLPGEERAIELELSIKAAIERELPIETDLGRWFPVWDCPGLDTSLSELGRRDEALAATTEAAGIWRRLAQADAAHEADLARVLCNLGIDLSAAGREQEALAVTGEAVEIRRRLARADPAAHEPGLATSLAYMGTLLSELGRAKEALATTEEAQEIRRRLAQANPSAHEQLLALPSAAATLTASASFTPTGVGSVCFRPAGGRAFRNVEDEIRQILDSDTDRATAVEITADSYGFTWIVIRRPPDQLESLVTDLHTVNSTLAKDGESLLCSLVAFRDPRQRQLAIVYLCERRTFYPFVPLPGEERAIELELSIKAAIERELPIETDLGRWFPVWDCPGLDTSLSELGRRDEALAATTEAAGIWRRLAQADAAHEADLARVLCNLGIDLSAAGREQEALAVTGEAVEIRRRLARADPAHEPDFAGALDSLGIRLSELGRRDEALAAAGEAVQIWRRLARAAPAHEPDFAGALDSLGIRLSELGRRDEALAATTEAAGIWRRLAQADAAHEADLARVLCNLGIDLSAAGREQEALAVTGEAVEIRRRLARADPAHEPDLASSLHNLGIDLSDAGRRAEALPVTGEAVEIRRRLAQADPATYEPGLAASLHNLGIRLSELGRRDEALAAAGEAVEIRRRLAQADPATYEPGLAASLHNLGIRLSELGRRDEALAAAGEAVEIRRRLAQADPATYEPGLAASLHNLGIRLSELGRRDEALAAAGEAVEIRRRLAQADPATYEPGLAASLHNLGIRLSELGRRDEALAAAGEAVEIRRRLAQADPATYEPGLAASLHNLGIRLSDLGRQIEAMGALKESITIYRRWVMKTANGFARDFHSVLDTAANVLVALGRDDDAATIRSLLAHGAIGEAATSLQDIGL